MIITEKYGIIHTEKRCFDLKLLTLNTHSLIEENYQQKLLDFVSVVCKIKPDIIALQEVNQSVDEEKADIEISDGYYPCEQNITINWK